MTTPEIEIQESKPARPKPTITKPKWLPQTGPRLVGCPAYPTTGELAGAPLPWCRTERGKMKACAACRHRNV